MFLADHLMLDAPRRTADGFLAVRAKAARVGVYSYTGREVDPDNAHGLRDQATVNVLRDDATVFDKRAVHSFIGKPITDDHPSEAVTAANWKDHARGTVMGAEWQEGGYLAFDLLLTDADAIAKVDAGKRELSNGYSASLEYGDFTAADGTKCQARQTNIVGNHVAIVDRGRAGPACRIADAAPCDRAPQSILDSLTPTEKPVMKITIGDAQSVDLSDAAAVAVAVGALQAYADAAKAKNETLAAKVVTLDATIVTKDAEIVKLTADLAAAEITPQKLRDAAKSYAITVGKAKAMGVPVTDAMDEPAIMKAVVDKAMPANTYTADHVAIAFAALTKDTKVADADPLRDALSAGPVNVQDAAAREAAALARANDHNAWRNPAKAA